MKYLLFIVNSTVFTSLLLLFFKHEAYAYIDPGTGSFIFQLIIGILAGGLLTLKVVRNKIVTFFKNLFRRRGFGESED